MNNKLLIFSHLKGGVGKTTMCALFASYLAEKGYPVIAFDADLQASLYRHRQRETNVDPEAKAPWNVDLLSTSDASKLTAIIEKLKTIPGIVLIDCPGNLNDRNLEAIYKAADAAIIPISFDADTVDATGLFVKALKHISNAELIFMPNCINVAERRSDELRQRAQTTEFLGLVGTVVPIVKQNVAVKRYTTLYPLDSKQVAAVKPAFDQIIQTLHLEK